MRSFTFTWPHHAEEVYVTGTFDDWTKSERLERVGQVFQKTVTLPESSDKILYKFVVDGEWTTDHAAPQEKDHQGNENNVLLPEQMDKLEEASQAAAINNLVPESTMAQLAGAVPLEDKKEEGHGASSDAAILSSAAPDSTTSQLAGAVPLEDKKEEGQGSSSDAAILSSAAPDSTTSQLAGAVPLEDTKDNVPPGGYPETPAADLDQQVKVDPLPAAEGAINPIKLVPGEEVPKDLTAGAIDSHVTLDKESYEKSDRIPGLETSLPFVTGNMIPESSLPITGSNDVNINTVAPDATTSALAGQVPLEPKVPDMVKRSQEEAHTEPEASAHSEEVKEKAAVEEELLEKVHEAPSTSEGTAGKGTEKSETDKTSAEKALAAATSAGEVALGAAIVAGSAAADVATKAGGVAADIAAKGSDVAADLAHKATAVASDSAAKATTAASDAATKVTAAASDATTTATAAASDATTTATAAASDAATKVTAAASDATTTATSAVSEAATKATAVASDTTTTATAAVSDAATKATSTVTSLPTTVKSALPGAAQAAEAEEKQKAAIDSVSSEVPIEVKESLREAGASPEAAVNTAAVEEKKEYEAELVEKVQAKADLANVSSEVPAAVKDSLKQAGASPEAAVNTAAVEDKKEFEAELVDKVQQKTAIDSVSSEVPAEVKASIKEANTSPEAAVNTDAVEGKKDTEAELLETVKPAEAAGESSAQNTGESESAAAAKSTDDLKLTEEIAPAVTAVVVEPPQPPETVRAVDVGQPAEPAKVAEEPTPAEPPSAVVAPTETTTAKRAADRPATTEQSPPADRPATTEQAPSADRPATTEQAPSAEAVAAAVKADEAHSATNGAAAAGSAGPSSSTVTRSNTDKATSEKKKKHRISGFFNKLKHKFA